MKKLAVVAVGGAAGLVAAWAAATAIGGHQVYEALLAQPRQWDRDLPFFEVHELKYDRRFTGAARTTTFKFGCAGHGQTLVTWHDTIAHGPWLGGLSFGAARIDSEFSVGGKAVPVRAHTIVGFDGSTDTTFELAPHAADFPQGRVAWQAGRLQWRSGSDGAVTYAAELPSFELRDAARGTSFALSGLALRGSGLPGVSWIVAGTGSGELASLTIGVQRPDGAAVETGVKDLKYTSDARLDDDGLLHATSSLSGRASVGELEFERFELQGSVKRLHAASYEGLFAGVAGASCDPQALRRDPAALRAALETLLPHNPELALDKLVLRHAGREARLAYAVGVEGVTDADLRADPAQALRTKTMLRVDLQLPAAWIDQMLPPDAAAEFLGRALDQGMLQREGDMLVAQLRLAQGTLSLNGRALPLR